MLAVLLHTFFWGGFLHEGDAVRTLARGSRCGRRTCIAFPSPSSSSPAHTSQAGRTDTVLGDYTSASVAEPTRRSRNATPQRRG